ncbi:hypothetical protein BBD39_07370 [Arsenophonus endosymbiont of Bemisia tabaci Asia II 3]|nr:hypothetical protein BBD39_07370 [Arsenophonus endosymbiont of Bemisia tabaci Asia II 3]
MNIKLIRQRRLKEWFSDKTLPEKEKSYLSQLINGKTSFGEKAARRIEHTYGMPNGYLDSESYDDIIKNKYKILTSQQIEILELFDNLPSEDAKQFLNEMKSRKAHYDLIFAELLEKRNNHPPLTRK